MTTAPIPVEQFGDWLGNLLAGLDSLETEAAGNEPSATDSETTPTLPFPFRPTSARCLKTVAQSFPRASHALNSATTPAQEVSNSPTARAVARLRDQIIHNLGTR